MRAGQWLGTVAIVCGLWGCGGGGEERPDAGSTTPDAGSTQPDAGSEQTPDAGEQQPDGGSVVPLKALSIDPSTGHAGDDFVLTGTGFTSSAKVFFGSAQVAEITSSANGLQLAGKVPAKAEVDGNTVGIRVIVDDRETRLEQAFTYQAGQAQSVQWCQLLQPTEITVWQGEQTPALWAKAYQPGVTPGAGAGSGLHAQVGWGEASASAESWSWMSAAFNKDEGNDDVFSESFLTGAPGEFLYAFRFSLDGVHYTYCDSDGDAFEAAKAGKLTVKGKPTIAAVNPATAKAGQQVTVTGTFLAGATFAFGANAATNVQIANDGLSATMIVPSGSGVVDVSATLDGLTVKKAAAFTYLVEIGAPVIATVSPAFLPVAGGTLTITGSQFGASGATVTVGGSAAQVTSQSDTQLVVTSPALAPGNREVEVTSGGKITRAPAPVPYVLKFSVNVDGNLSDWPATAKVAASSVPSDWGTGNELRALYMGYDQTNLYLGIEGKAEAANALVGYLSLSSLSFGTGDLRQLTDGVGALDDMLSSGFNVTAPGFRAHYGFGLFGTAADLVDGVDEGRGVRLLQDPADFGWARATVKRSAGAVEIAIPWRPASPGATDAFAPFPSGSEVPLKVQAFVRIVADGGQLHPNQSLPTDPNATDATLHAQVSSVASIEVR